MISEAVSSSLRTVLLSIRGSIIAGNGKASLGHQDLKHRHRINRPGALGGLFATAAGSFDARGVENLVRGRFRSREGARGTSMRRSRKKLKDVRTRSRLSAGDPLPHGRNVALGLGLGAHGTRTRSWEGAAFCMGREAWGDIQRGRFPC